MSDNMWAYVDESGCMGMKIGSGSSPFFTVVAVIFDDRQTVSDCYSRVEQLKSELKPGKEFSFTSCNHEQRVRFLREMCRFSFNYFGINFDKAQIGSFSRPFLHTAVLASFASHADRIRHAKVVIDKTGSSGFRKMMSKSLKNDLNRMFDRDMITRVKSTESHCHNLLQLADMLCGAVARSFHPDKIGRHDYRTIVRRHEWTISEFP